MLCYRTMENTDIEMLHHTFVTAFSDYQVKIDVPLWRLQLMLRRRGYVPDLSLGAFKEGELVGFVLNGFRRWNSKPTVYDIGTGVIGQYRKQGITSNMFLKVKELLKERGVEQYLLEVIQSNTPALELYKKQGFDITREFACFQLDKDKFMPEAVFNVEHIDGIDSSDWEQLTCFWDFMPSWQNSTDSINAAAEAFVYSTVYDHDTIIGYGIADRKTGDIPQIAVHKNYRHRGVARSIIADLIKSTESQKISILNVDNQSEAMTDFLHKSGFQHGVNQYEMILAI